MSHSLTTKQQRVLDTLRQAGAPLTAYALLDQLRDHGLTAPTQVYRALDKLAEQGVVHRLESLNAYVCCSHPDEGSHDFSADRKSTRLNSSHLVISYAVFCLKKKHQPEHGSAALSQRPSCQPAHLVDPSASRHTTR